MECLQDEAAELQMKLGKKATFEDAVKKLTVLVSSKYQLADPEGRKAIDTAVSRAATLLQTRYSGEASRGFWSAGARLFEAAASVSDGADQKRKLHKYLEKAHEFLGEEELPGPEAPSRPDARFLFEGQLSQDPPPLLAPDAHALFSSMFSQFIGADGDDVSVDATDGTDQADERATADRAARAEQHTPAPTRQENAPPTSSTPADPPSDAEPPSNATADQIAADVHTAQDGPASQISSDAQAGSDRQTPAENGSEGASTSGGQLELPEWAEALRAPNGGLFDQLQGNIPVDRPGIQGALQRLQEMLHAGNTGVFPGLEEALQASLEEAGQRTKQRPAAAKDEVERLPVMDVDEAKLKHYGKGTQCAVCREDLVIGDKLQQMPCNHLFHPPCLAPWLEDNNSCPICRYELRTDDNEYERRKEREKQEEEDRKGAANAVREGQFMYM